MKKIICLLLLILYTGCFPNKYPKYILITFVICDNFPLKYAEIAEKGLYEYLYKEFNIISHIEFEENNLPKQYKRYDALKLINKYQPYYYSTTILFTERDIEFKGKGVLGLSLHPGNLCIVSTYRLKNKKEIWKLVTHEFIHTYFDYSHCDNDTCLMKDAMGKVNFKNKQGLCIKCRRNIKSIIEK